MADHLWTILCEKHLVDPDSQVVSLHDVLEVVGEEGLQQRIDEAQATGKKGALVATPMQLVSWWWRSDPLEESLEIRFRLLNPNGEKLLEQSVSLPWGAEAATPTTRRVFLRLKYLPVAMLGYFWFIVEQQRVSKTKAHRWTVVAKIPLKVETA